MGGCGQRQGHRQLAGGVEHDAQVLDEDVDRRQRGVVAGQDVRHPVGKHPAGTGRVADHLVELVGVGAGADAQRHRLAGCGDVHPGQVLVDHLDGRAHARPVAQPVDLAGHRVEQAAGRSKGLGPARGHHRHLAGGGLDRTARDRGVDQPQPKGLQAGLPQRRQRGVDRGRADHHRAGLQVRRQARVTKQQGFSLGRSDHQHQHHIAGRRQLGHAGGDPAAGLGNGGVGGRVQVEAPGGDAARQCRERRAPAHRAQADHAECGGGGHDGLAWPWLATAAAARAAACGSPRYWLRIGLSRASSS